MSDPLPGLVVLAIGGSIAPPLLLLTILFLGSQRPLPNATALAIGYFATCAVIGVAGLTFFGEAAGTVSAVSRVVSVMVGGLLVVLGLKGLLNAPDPDASPPGWMESTSSMSPARAFGLGVALFPLQIKNLAIFVVCLNLIIASSLSPRGNIAALGLVLVIFAIPVLALIGLGRARLLADMDGEAQPHDHGGALLRVRNVLPLRGPLGTVRVWVILRTPQRRHWPEAYTRAWSRRRLASASIPPT